MNESLMTSSPETPNPIAAQELLMKEAQQKHAVDEHMEQHEDGEWYVRDPITGIHITPEEWETKAKKPERIIDETISVSMVEHEEAIEMARKQYNIYDRPLMLNADGVWYTYDNHNNVISAAEWQEKQKTIN